ncbi:MAG: response regulator [Saprospiraceae bacterium]|nr:response regulator [Saprospiraceae bacterium]
MSMPTMTVPMNGSYGSATMRETVHILLIEDNPGDARLVEILLEESDLPNVQIIHRLTLGDGIAELKKRDFAVVLLDLTLPDSRGFETLERLIATKPDVNVVVMTGLADKVLGLNAVKAGAQDFLMKGGFDSDLLSKTLRYAVERKNVLIKLAAATRAREVAEESARMKEQFIASISHEMRTPMNAIYGMSNLLAQTNLDTEQRSFIDSVRQSSEILLGVINDILEVSTLQNGQMHFESADFDIMELMKNLVSVMQYKKEEKPLEFQLNIDPSVPKYLLGDKLRLNQILYNIVGNAVKFTDSGFIKISIAMGKQEGDGLNLSFIVQDSGIGIPQDKIDTIFESFTRVRTKERIFEGTGLGLAIVKNLVVQQGGRVFATSEQGCGTTITVEMSFKKGVSPVQLSAGGVPEKLKFEDSKTRPFNLFLVEDHKINQMVARKTLERQFDNVKITIAENGRECLDMLQSGREFDIILLDIQMPIMDGNETIAYIRENMPNFKTPVLAMTAHAYISKDNLFKTYGFDDFVLKPFEPEQLFSKIHQYLTQFHN